MSELCTGIENAIKGLNVGSKPEDAKPLIEVLETFNKSHIEGSKLFKEREAIARKLQEKGTYADAIDPGIPGATGFIQQNQGQPNFLEIVEGTRTETMRLDNGSLPTLSSVAQKCGDTEVTSWFRIRDGKRVLSSVSVTPDLEIVMDIAGKPIKVKSMF